MSLCRERYAHYVLPQVIDQVPGDNNVRPIFLLFVTGDVQITRGYPIDVALLDHLEQFGIHIIH